MKQHAIVLSIDGEAVERFKRVSGEATSALAALITELAALPTHVKTKADPFTGDKESFRETASLVAEQISCQSSQLA